MPLPDSQDIDTALFVKLSGDATLLSYMTNGVYFDEAPPNMRRFVRITLVDENDEPIFGGRKFEDARYLVTAVAYARQTGLAADVAAATAAVAAVKSAAARIDVLLEDATLTVTGYTTFEVARESRIRAAEPDDVDPTIRWHHHGGTYRVQMTLT